MAVVRLEVQGPIGHVVLDRPPANSYDVAFLDDFGSAINQARFDANVRAIIVRSASEKFFCAGADVKMFAATDAAYHEAFAIYANETFSRFERTGKLVVAAINGHCLGGGLEIALSCDFRWAAEGAYGIGLPEVTLGLLPGTGGTQRLPRLIGRQKALEHMVTGKPVPPAQALELGIVDRVVPAADLVSAAVSWLEGIVATGPTLAIGKIKLAAVIGGGMPFAQGLSYEHEALGRLFGSEDAKEGITAFGEKRKPVYKGK